MKTRISSGEGWAFTPDDGKKPHPGRAPENSSPKPKIRLEKRSGGKYVTCVAGLHTYGEERLNAIARELKAACGAGGTVKNGIIEIQGDKVDYIQAWFKSKG